jgi:hypothetical protein
MTCLLWHKNRFYADSNMVKGGELFESLTKIQSMMGKPIEIKSETYAVDDRIVGWACTGTNEVGGGVVVSLIKKGLDETMLSLKNAVTMQLINVENHLTVFMIGEKSNYKIDLKIGYTSWDAVPHEKGWAGGTGGYTAAEAVLMGGDPVRAMYKACYVDDNSGGMIDVWVFTPPEGTNIGDRKALFYREGMMEDLSHSEIEEVILPHMADPRDLTWSSWLAINLQLMRQLGVSSQEELGLLASVWHATKPILMDSVRQAVSDHMLAFFKSGKGERHHLKGLAHEENCESYAQLFYAQRSVMTTKDRVWLISKEMIRAVIDEYRLAAKTRAAIPRNPKPKPKRSITRGQEKQPKSIR